MDKIIVSLLGSTLIGIIYWFFFAKKDESVMATDNLTVLVDGGYTPNTISFVNSRPVTITFLRKDPNPCLEDIYFPDYKIKKYLPLNTPVRITLSPPHQTKSGFHCSMNMYNGTLTIL